MAHYLLKAQFQKDLLAELRTRLDSGEINKMRPFGTALQYSLDTYFTSLSVEKVQQGKGWAQIESLPLLWNKSNGGTNAL